MNGRRALLRVARRDARRNRGRAVLVVLMIAVPVAAMGATITTIRTATLTTEQDLADEMGQADLIVSTHFQPLDWQALLPEGSRSVPYRGSETAYIVHDGEVFNASVLETDLSDPIFRGDRELVAGRAARGPSEVVVSRELKDQLDVRVGSRVELREPKRMVTVTGVAVAQNSIDWYFLVAGAGWRDMPGDSFPLDATWRVDLPPGADTAAVATALRRQFLPVVGSTDVVTTRQEVLDYSKPSTAKRAAELSVTYLAGALLLVWTGSVAAAAFAVGARRRLREVGLVAASGGSPRQLRALLLADGVVLGLAGAITGVGLGVAIASVISHHLDRFTNHVNGPLRVPVGGLIGAATVGLVAAMIAALIPAVGAARVPVVSALAGLRPLKPRTRSWLTVGAISIVAGVVLCTYGGGRGEENAAIAGVVLVVGGVAMATGGLLGLVARLSSRLPVAIRFAARDANRARTRSAPAIAAAMLGLAATVGATTVALSGEAKERYGYEPYLRDDQILVDLSGGFVPGPVVPDVPAVRRAVTEALPGAQVGALGQAAPQAGGGAGLRVAAAGLPIGRESLHIGDAGTLAALGARRAEAAFDAGSVLALGEGSVQAGKVRLVSYNGNVPTDWGELAATDVDVAAPRGLPRYLISETTARVLGLRVENPQLIVRLPRPATDRDERRVLAAVLDVSDAAIPGVTRNHGLPDRAAALGLALGAGAGLALFVVGLVTALARAELRPYLRTLAAVGAAPRARRAVSAAQSGVMAAVAALLAVPAGLIPAIALVRTQEGPYVRYPTEFLQTPETIRHPVAIPWIIIAAVVFAVPLVAALGGGLFTRMRTAADR